jgi:hypothetical protein
MQHRPPSHFHQQPSSKSVHVDQKMPSQSLVSVHAVDENPFLTQYNLLNPEGGEDSPNFGKKASLSSET